MKIALFANTDWYLYNFRLGLAQKLRAAGMEVVLVSPAGTYGDRLRALGFHWEPISMSRRGFNPFREVATLVELWNLLRRLEIDVIHNFTVKCSLYGSLIGMLLRIKRINALAGLGFIFSSRRISARILRFLISPAFRILLGGDDSVLVFQNRNDLEQIRKISVRSAGFILIPSSGVDTLRFSPDSKAKGEFRVVLASRLLRDKGVIEYCEAAATVLLSYPDIKFILAGEFDPGNPDSLSSGDIEQWTKNNTVHWLGHIDDTVELFRSSSLMVLPSYYGEGVPRCLVEGAACGLAIITTNLPGCRDAVDDGETGILIPPRNSDALAKEIEYFYTNPEFLRTCGEKARRKAISDFDMELVNQRTVEVYQKFAGFQSGNNAPPLG